MKSYLFSFTCVCMLASCSQNQSSAERYQSKLPTKDTLTENSSDEDELPSPTNSQKLGQEAFIEFIPDGYVVKDWKTGNLNRDDQDDIVIILEEEEKFDANSTADGAQIPSPKDEPNLNEAKRPVLLLTRSKNGKLKFAGRNDNIVLCSSCGGVFGDPYSSIAIKNGYFSIEHYGGSNWRWTRIMTFKYSEQNKAWYLHRDGGDNYHTSNPDKVESKALTKKDFGTIKFEDYRSDMFDF